MGFITLSMLHIVAAFEWRDPTQERVPRRVDRQRSIQPDDPDLARRWRILGTSVGVFQRMLDTVQLTGDQWRPCLIAVAGFLVFAEIEKLVVRRFGHDETHPKHTAAAS